MLAINGMPDHLHLFIGLHPALAISDLVKEIKVASNQWIYERKFTIFCLCARAAWLCVFSFPADSEL